MPNMLILLHFGGSAIATDEDFDRMSEILGARVRAPARGAAFGYYRAAQRSVCLVNCFGP
jgi:hypothetical protein